MTPPSWRRDGKLVVVTINYRLNLFGFLAHPALDAEGHAFGNYGIMDMQAALQWVKRNAAAFGGDPSNVTLGGQSAGAGAAAANVVSPGAKGLFHRAIFQSGGYTPFATQAIAEERGKKFAAAAGCNGRRCRQMPARPARRQDRRPGRHRQRHQPLRQRPDGGRHGHPAPDDRCLPQRRASTRCRS